MKCLLPVCGVKYCLKNWHGHENHGKSWKIIAESLRNHWESLIRWQYRRNWNMSWNCGGVTVLLCSALHFNTAPITVSSAPTCSQSRRTKACQDGVSFLVRFQRNQLVVVPKFYCGAAYAIVHAITESGRFTSSCCSSWTDLRIFFWLCRHWKYVDVTKARPSCSLLPFYFRYL